MAYHTAAAFSPRPDRYTRAGSTAPLFAAASTALANSWTRRSIFELAGVAAVTTCQPRSRVQFRHSTASAPSSSAMAGDPFTAGWAVAGARPSRLMAQARTDFPDQFFDFIRFLERGHGKNVAIVLFQVRLQRFGKVRQFGRVLQVLLVLRFQDFFLLRLAVGHVNVGFFGRRWRPATTL